MLRAGRALLLVVGAAVALAALPSAAQAANPCRAAASAPGSKVLVATNTAVVFHSRKAKQDVACTYGAKRLVKLENIACCEGLRYALAGRYLGYIVRTSQVDYEVDVFGGVDLKTGKQLRYGGKRQIDPGGYVRGF